MVTLYDKVEPLIGRKSAAPLAVSFGMYTVQDLLRHYPRRYAERGELTDIAGLELGEHVTVLARVLEVTQRPLRDRKRVYLSRVVITDGNRKMECAFFGPKGYISGLAPGRSALFAGKVSVFNRKLQLQNPEYQLIDGDTPDGAIDSFIGLIPVYPSSAGIQSWQIARCVRQVLQLLDPVEDPVPMELRAKLSLGDYDESLRNIHTGRDWDVVKAAQQRLKWDEALAIQLTLAQRRSAATARPAPACPRVDGGIRAAFEERLPFTLTAGQVEVGEAIAADLEVEHPMNRLLQGEVGSGKTIVALRAMLQVVDSGRQAALLAPTEVLAAQHFRSLSEMLGDLALGGELGAAETATRITLLTGSQNTAQRKQALLDTVSGAAGIVVGTHALIQDKVEFADLGLVVVDEQHRFGVEQRDALRTRAGENVSPHVLVMTATPIPRTVAMTVYGDLETSSLRELPKGRAPIGTTVVPVAEKPAWLERAWERIREEVAGGHQAYVVCPRIGVEDEEPTVDDSGNRPPLAVLDIAAQLRDGPLSGLRVEILHGRQPADEKDAAMRAYAAGEVDVLVATTVIEVGVDVPNATAMVIMDAERFGVSQLHQLRGRVGRGTAPGICLLVTEMPDATRSRDRLDAVASTVDGFELARLDLEMRREGDILGALQSGRHSGLKLLSLLRDEDIIARAREEAQALIAYSPDLAYFPGLARMVADLVADDRAEYLEKA